MRAKPEGGGDWEAPASEDCVKTIAIKFEKGGLGYAVERGKVEGEKGTNHKKKRRVGQILRNGKSRGGIPSNGPGRGKRVSRPGKTDLIEKTRVKGQIEKKMKRSQ